MQDKDKEIRIPDGNCSFPCSGTEKHVDSDLLFSSSGKDKVIAEQGRGAGLFPTFSVPFATKTSRF